MQNKTKNLNQNSEQNQNQEKSKKNWQKPICLALNIALLFLIIVSPFIWIMRDGLGPNAYDSNGLEALYRFFMTFYFGPLFLIIFCLRLFIGGCSHCYEKKSPQKEPFSRIVVKIFLAILLLTGLVAIIIGGVFNYKIAHNQTALSEKQVVLITDKTEYQTGEEVKLTVGNNLEEKIFFGIVSLEEYQNNSWTQIVKDIYCECNAKCEKLGFSIKASYSNNYFWNQKIGLCNDLTFGKKLRFKIRLWNNPSDMRERIYYSNEFTIKEKSALDTSNWQTYRNEEYGFEVKYPENLKIYKTEMAYGQNAGYEINFMEEEKLYGTSIKIFKINQGETNKEAFDRINKVELTNVIKDKKMIAGIEAEYYRNIPSHNSYDEVFFVYNDYFYGVSKYAIGEDIFDQILSSFKFID